MSKKRQSEGPASRAGKTTPPPLPGTGPRNPSALPGVKTAARLAPVFPRVGKSTPPPLPPAADGPALDESQAAHLSDLLALVGSSSEDDSVEASDEVPTVEVPYDDVPSDELPTVEVAGAGRDTEPAAGRTDLHAAASAVLTARGAGPATNDSQLAHLDELLAAVNESTADLAAPTSVDEQEVALEPPAPPVARQRSRPASETELAQVDDLLAAVGQSLDPPAAPVPPKPAPEPPKPPRPSKPLDESLVAPVDELLAAATRVLDAEDEPAPPPAADEPTPRPNPAAAPPTESLVVHVDELLASLSKSLDHKD